MDGLPASLILSVAASEPSAQRLSELFDAHHQRLYRLARRLTPSADDALDLVQETFLKAARALPSVPAGDPDEEAWLVRVLINTRRDQWRATATRAALDCLTPPSAAARRDAETPLMARVAVWRALDTLAPRRRSILVLHELEGLGVPAIAALLGIRAVTVRWHLSRGRRELARVLRPWMGDPT